MYVSGVGLVCVPGQWEAVYALRSLPIDMAGVAIDAVEAGEYFFLVRIGFKFFKFYVFDRVMQITIVFNYLSAGQVYVSRYLIMFVSS